MTFKILIAVILCIHYGYAEPPVNSYLPSSKSASSFSKNYAPPAANVSFNFGYSSRGSNSDSFRDSKLAMYGPPAARSQESSFRNQPLPKSLGTYNTNDFNTQPNIGHSSHAQKPHDQMSLSAYSSYDAPASYQRSQVPQAKYGVPADDSLPVIEENLLRKNSHEVSHDSHTPIVQPEIISARNSLAYGPPTNHQVGRSGSDDNAEVVPYDFSYEVMEPEAGVSLGHHENHDGKTAEGVYHNLLPDGRLLTVEYWADDGGFKPKLSYKILPTSKHNAGPY